MELRSFLQAIICTVMFVYIRISSAVDNDDVQATHLRQWSEWYNTDNPTIDGDDDESINSIRKRGLEVCDGKSPIDSVCRLANHHDIVFNADTSSYTDNILANPCTTTGVVCLRIQQEVDVKCRDYEIRFECLRPRTEEEVPENLGVVGVAAGLSIVVPILCVIIMHLFRLIKERRARHRRSILGENNNDQGIQTDGDADLPPTYSELFGENSSSTERLLSSSSSSDSVISILTSSRDSNLNLQNRRVSDANVMNDTERISLSDDVTDSGIYTITENQGIYSSRSGSIPSLQSSTSQLQNCHQSRQNRFHMAGMHLSIHELLLSADCHSTQLDSPLQSPTLSYIQTPPPTYSDALAIIGGVPFKADTVALDPDTIETDAVCCQPSSVMLTES